MSPLSSARDLYARGHAEEEEPTGMPGKSDDGVVAVGARPRLAALSSKFMSVGEIGGGERMGRGHGVLRPIEERGGESSGIGRAM